MTLLVAFLPNQSLQTSLSAKCIDFILKCSTKSKTLKFLDLNDTSLKTIHQENMSAKQGEYINFVSTTMYTSSSIWEIPMYRRKHDIRLCISIMT